LATVSSNVVQNLDEKTPAQHRPINPIGIQKGRQQYVPGRPSNEKRSYEKSTPISTEPFQNSGDRFFQAA